MQRKHVVALGKLALITALMVLVFSNVQWSDTLITRSPDGVEQRETGVIVGPWDDPEPLFQRLDAGGKPVGEPRPVARSGQPEGGSEVVSPGFGTYVVNLDRWLFAAGALCYFLSVMFAGTRWWWLLRVNALRVTWWEATRFTWIGLFFNNVVPGQTGGDVVKAVYIMKHCPGGRLPALMSVLVDRILGLGSLALLGALVVLFALEQEGFGRLALMIWGVLALVAVLGIVAFSKRIRRLVRLDELLNKLPARLSGLLKRIDTAVYFYRRHKAGIALWMVAGMVNHSLSVTSTMLVGRALNVGMPTLEFFVLVPVINILSAVPIGPNGWGVGEAAYRYLFGTYGAAQLSLVPRATAELIMGTRGVALSVVFRIHMTLWSLLGGLLVLLERDRVTRQEIEEEVALEASESWQEPAAEKAD